MAKTVRLDHLGAALPAAAGLLVVLYARPAEANYPGKPGKIACSGHDENDYEIYTIKVGGGGKLNVTDNDSTSDDYYPDYAPGGKRIAYTNFVTGGDEEIYTIEPDGEASTRSPALLRPPSRRSS